MKTIYFCPWCRNFLCEECEEKTSIYHIHPLFKIKNSFQYDNALKININTIVESTKKGMKNMFDTFSNFFSDKKDITSKQQKKNIIEYNQNNVFFTNINNSNYNNNMNNSNNNNMNNSNNNNNMNNSNFNNNMNNSNYNNNMNNVNMNNSNNNNFLDNKKIKINQMKQLYSLDNISDEKIEEALIKANWNFDEAIIYLVPN
jgi:hypothetical protein